MGAANQTVDMGMRQLRSSDLGDRRHHHAPLQAATDLLVLGRLSDGHPLQRHLGPAIATPARLGIVPKCLAALCQAASEHGRARPDCAGGLVEIDETEIPCRSKNDPVTGGGGRSHQGKMLIVGAVEVQDGEAGPGRIRLNKVSDYSADSLHPFIADNLAPSATAKTDGWSAYPGAPSDL